MPHQAGVVSNGHTLSPDVWDGAMGNLLAAGGYDCAYAGKWHIPYRGLIPSPPLFDRMPTYRTQGKRSLNFLSAECLQVTGLGEVHQILEPESKEEA